MGVQVVDAFCYGQRNLRMYTCAKVTDVYNVTKLFHVYNIELYVTVYFVQESLSTSYIRPPMHASLPYWPHQLLAEVYTRQSRTSIRS